MDFESISKTYWFRGEKLLGYDRIFKRLGLFIIDFRQQIDF